MRCCKLAWSIGVHIPLQLYVLYGVTFLLLLPLLCTNMSHSIYHVKNHQDDEKTRLNNENEARVGDALPVIAKYNESLYRNKRSRPELLSDNMDVAVTIITVSRNRHAERGKSPRYLTQVVARFIDLINTTSTVTRKSYGIFLCNVDSKPDAYAEMKPLKEILPTFQRTPISKKLAIKQSIFEKEKQDYVFCLEETLKRNISFAFLVEDDGYPHKDLLPVLERVIDSHLSVKSGLKGNRNVTYVKFYHPERLLGYISLEWERLPELLAFSFLLGTLLSVILMKGNTEWKRNNVIWFLCVLYFALFALAIGRVNLLEMRRLSVQTYQVTPAASCCTPAMLFTRAGGISVVKQLKQVKCRLKYGKDMALEDIRRREGYRTLMVQPNVFKHIGMVSSLRTSLLDPFIV